jgi:thiol-disulfide isomerase/thioredoxin
LRSQRLAASTAIAESTLPFGPASYPPEIGEPHPDFSAFDHEGLEFSLSGQQGKAVILHWCALWCQPCRNSAEVEGGFIALNDARYGADSWALVDALLQDVNGNPADQMDAQLWRSELGTPARTLHPDGDSAAQMIQILGLDPFNLPTYVVIDLFGKVVGSTLGFGGAATLDELDALLRDAVGPPVLIDGFES